LKSFFIFLKPNVTHQKPETHMEAFPLTNINTYHITHIHTYWHSQYNTYQTVPTVHIKTYITCIKNIGTRTAIQTVFLVAGVHDEVVGEFQRSDSCRSLGALAEKIDTTVPLEDQMWASSLSLCAQVTMCVGIWQCSIWPQIIANINNVNSCYIKFQGTIKHSLRYPKFGISEVWDIRI